MDRVRCSVLARAVKVGIIMAAWLSPMSRMWGPVPCTRVQSVAGLP
jgi:hypothetical protein